MLRVLTLIVALICSNAVAAGELTIATFNAEFLTRPKVHMKFGFSFNLSGADLQTWNQAGHRDQKFADAAAAVAKVIADIDADMIALVEVGDLTDVNELNAAVAAEGVSYGHIAVCVCTVHTT